jgi:hypothetical protein
MGPPVNHGAFFVPWAHPDTDGEPVKNARVFSVLGEFFAIRFKELNTYSGRLTRCIAIVLAGFAQRGGMGSAARLIAAQCALVRISMPLMVATGR